MGATTPKLALPYPVGTDRVMDGDNAMQALAERIEARMPWGIVQRVGISSGVTIGAALTNVPGLSITATFTANRLYRLSTSGGVQMQIANGRASVLLAVDGSAIAAWDEDLGLNAYAGYSLEHTFTTSAGTHTVNVQAASTAGTQMVIQAGPSRQHLLTLEDIGPSA